MEIPFFAVVEGYGLMKQPIGYDHCFVRKGDKLLLNILYKN
ncbi:MAG TPA: hypothetical protein VJ697_11845 [Nitrososphaeraceae archaeon]|nr:hypothetical protein [Nitrososphaeraceae archaeon]